MRKNIINTGKLTETAFRQTLVLLMLLACSIPGAKTLQANEQDADAAVTFKAPAINTMAPDFTLKSYSGENIRLYELRGNLILLHFWASWSGASIKLLKEFELMQHKYADDGFRVISIATDPQKAENTLSALQAEHLPLLDYNAFASQLFQIKTIPVMYLLNRDGTVAMKLEGFDPRHHDLLENKLKSILADEEL